MIALLRDKNKPFLSEDYHVVEFNTKCIRNLAPGVLRENQK